MIIYPDGYSGQITIGEFENTRFEDFGSNLFVSEFGKIFITPYLEYVIATFGKEFFKQKIGNLDINGTYMRKNVISGVRKESVDSELERFRSSLDELEERKRNWKNSHPDYYRQQVCLPSSEGLKIYIPNTEDIEISLDDCIQGYKYANGTLNSFGTSLDVYCVEKRPMLNIEHKAEYDEFVETERKILGIPTRAEIEASLPQEEIVKTRLCLNRQPSSSTSSSEAFTQAFLSNMLKL